MDVWTVKRCLDWTNEYLESKGDENPRLSAQWLLTSATGLARIELYTNADRPLSPDELDAMHRMVIRRAKGEPLQYIVGETSFRTIDIICEPGVLIPRPETEMLVEEVLTYLDREVFEKDGEAPRRTKAALPWNAQVEAMRQAEEEKQREQEQEAKEQAAEELEASDEQPEPEQEPEPEPAPRKPRIARILEVGCGTGCITLSFAAERAGRVACVATDINPQAVALACRNRDALGIAPEIADFREGNLVSPLDRETEWGTFDVLVSNPPYIPTSVLAEEVPAEVKEFEPHLALDGGADGLDIFRRLVNAAPSMLRPGGLFACELHETTLDAAAEICRRAGFERVRIARDLAGRPRFVLACVPESVVQSARERFARR